MAKSKVGFAAWLAAIVIFYFARPYFVWPVIGDTTLNFILSVVLFFCFYQKKHIEYNDRILFVFLIILLLYFGFKMDANIFGLISICLVSSIPFAEREFYKDTFEAFQNIYCAIIGFSLVVYVMVLFGIISPITTIEAIDETNGYGIYSVYPLCVTQPLSFRFYGVFDEPGVVGTVSAIMLACRQMKFNDWKSIILLLSGIMSMSLFFYLMIALCLLLKMTFKKNRSFGTLLIIALLSFYFFATRDNDIMYDTIWRRFVWNEETNFITGDNRMHGSEDVYDAIKGTSEFWFGVSDRHKYLQMVEGTSSYKNVIAVYGFIFFVLYILFFVLNGLKKKTDSYSFILYILVVLLTTYQRPNTFSSVWLFLFTCVIMLPSVSKDTSQDSEQLLDNSQIVNI